MSNYYSLIRPLLFKLDPEAAHRLTLKTMKAGLLPPPGPTVTNKALEVNLWGLKFPNPVGLSAGFDKNAEVVGPAFKLGFGFVETGTVTPRAQGGNPKPRVFRSPEHGAVINRMGFPGDGAQVYKANLEKFLSRKERPRGVVGVNIGMNKTQTEPVRDYALLIQMLAPMADYVALNISSPNTPGLRDQQSRDNLLNLIATLKDERKKACGDHPPPLLVKFAPDLTEAQQEELAQAALDAGLDGLILTNTTLERPATLPADFAKETGGLSGRPLKEKSTAVIRNFYKLTKGKIPIIGLGGIENGRDAYEKIKAGASLVQLYTALVYKGPGLINSINHELLDLLKADGYTTIMQAIGKDSGG